MIFKVLDTGYWMLDTIKGFRCQVSGVSPASGLNSGQFDQ
jgi:hypothetical protein